MRRAHYAEKSGDWESYLGEVLKECRLCVWASMKVRECHNEVESEDEGRVSIAQDIPRESTDFLRSHTVARVPSVSLLSA